MGGVADYSGGLCLQWPLKNSIICRITPHEQPVISARTRAATPNGTPNEWIETVEISLDELSQTFPRNAREKFVGRDSWALHVVGALVMLQWQIGWSPTCGMRIEIASNAPPNAGIASSAALEVAVLTAINRAFGLMMDGREIARWARLVETQIVGAPDEIRAPLAAALARNNHLIPIRCQPDLVEDFIALPADIEIWGISSGVLRTNNAAYNLARQATMMGRAMLTQLIPDAMRGPDGELYLANVSPDVWRALRTQIPEQLSGADFLREYKHLDEVENLESATIYAVRLATEHPIYETDRAQRFARLLRQMDANPAARKELGRAAGELMIQSHFSYDHRCKLGDKATDLIVELAREAGAKNGIYGAKITGHGAGGAVAILGDRQLNPDLNATIERIAADYAKKSGHAPQMFRGSSEGANVES